LEEDAEDTRETGEKDMTEIFTLGQVLSVTTGRLVCTMEGLYSIMNFLTGENLFTHQLVRAFDPCKKYVFEQYPGLTGVDVSDVNKDNYMEKLSKLAEVYGDVFQLSPMPKGYYEPKDAIVELSEMVSHEKIIVVRGGQDE
jgi:hypothetical protein